MKLYKRWFSLVEIIIVIFIIWILSAALFPSVSGYLRRADDIKTQELARGFIAMINQYVNDNWGFDPLYTLLADDSEYYCYWLDNTECPALWSNFHQWLDNFFRSSPEWQTLLEKREQYRDKLLQFFPWISTEDSIWGLYRENNLYLWSIWYILPGEDMTDTRKRLWMYWVVDGKGSYYPSTDWEWGITWVSLSPEADKRCAPGFAVAYAVDVALWIKATWCYYRFE